LKAFRTISLLLLLVLAQQARCADLPAGKIVWWGDGVFLRNDIHHEHTNGVIESDNEIVSNVVAVAAEGFGGLALKDDGTVFALGDDMIGGKNVPAGLSNVVSITGVGNSCWAIKRDGTVARWGIYQDEANIVAGLSNITAIASAGYNLALTKDGIVLGFRFDTSRPAVDPTTGLLAPSNSAPVRLVTVHGQVLSNVVGLASMDFTPVILKSDGTVFCLGYQTPGTPPEQPSFEEHDGRIYMYLGGESWRLPYEYTSADPVMVGGEVLSNVVSLASSGGRVLALKKNGTVVTWGGSDDGQSQVPAGLSNVIAIAVWLNSSLALKTDGTVVAWGGNPAGQTSVPAGLSNVVAISAGPFFSLAVTTGNVPSSVYIQPHGRLEEMEREADLIFKGRVISSKAITNTSFPDWGKPHATQFNLISVLKGKVDTNAPVFWHNTSGPEGGGGGSPPSWHQFETGQCYLVYAAKLDKPDNLYTVPLDATNRPNEFRQLYRDGVTRTLDDRPVGSGNVKDVHWFELNLLLTDSVPSNEFYSIRMLDRLSLTGREDDRWLRSDDFKREMVLKAALPLVTNANEQVAVSAIGCFQVGGSHINLIEDQGGWMPIVCGCSGVTPECVARVAPYANALVAVANSSPSRLCRVAAIAALSCTRFTVVSNSLPRWLADTNAEVRNQAVLLLPDFPGEFCERSLQERATDASQVVRAAVADAIGNGRIESLLPTLGVLFSTSPVRTNSGPWPHKGLQGDGYFAEVGADDIHTSAGYALLKFDEGQVDSFLKTNLNDPGFQPSFLCKLAEKDAGPWLKDMADFLEGWLAREKQKAPEWGGDPKTYTPPLSGTSARLWNIIYDHLRGLPTAEFASGKTDRYLEVLENTGSNYSREPVMIYELYRMKGLSERAAKFRSQNEKKSDARYLNQFFDRVDAQFTNSPPPN
jgi:hypothetical protein